MNLNQLQFKSSQEKFMPIKDFGGLYEIGNKGSVLRILSPSFDKAGYLRIGLGKYGNRKNFLVHRLVALSFLNVSQNSFEINHKNLDKTDNSVDNLECTNRKANIFHAVQNGRWGHMRGENHHQHKITKEIVMRIINEYKTGKHSQRCLAKKYGLSQANIWAIVNKKTWRHLHEDLKLNLIDIKKQKAKFNPYRHREDEIWKRFEFAGSRYAVSNYGRIAKYMPFKKSKYARVGLSLQGDCRQFFIRKLLRQYWPEAVHVNR